MDPSPHLIKKNENPFLTPKTKSRSKSSSSSSKRSRKSKTPTTEKVKTQPTEKVKTQRQRQTKGQGQTPPLTTLTPLTPRQGQTPGQTPGPLTPGPLTPRQGQTPGPLTPGQGQSQEKRRNPFLEPRPTVKRQDRNVRNSHNDRDRINDRSNDRNYRKTANPFVKESGLGGTALGVTTLGGTTLGVTALGKALGLGPVKDVVKESEQPKLVINVGDTAEFPSLQSPKTASSPNPVQNPVWGGKPRLNFKEVALKGEKEKEKEKEKEGQQQSQQQSQQEKCPTTEKKQNAETTHNIADIARHVVRHNMFNPAIVTTDTGASVLTDYSIQRERINQNMFMTPQKHYNKPTLPPRYTAMNEDADNESTYFEDDGFDRIYNNTK
jgi:hypothetical protein